MSTEDYLLSNFNISIEDAANIILDYVNSNNIESLYNLLLGANVNNDMVADVLQNQYAGLTGDDVKNFFNSNKLDGNALDSDILEADNAIESLSFIYDEGILTNTSSSSIVIEDIGFNMEGIFNYNGFGSYSFSIEGTIETGYSISAYGSTEYVPGSNFIDQTIPENEYFNLNNFLPDSVYEDIADISGSSTTEYTIITSAGNFTDSTSIYF